MISYALDSNKKNYPRLKIVPRARINKAITIELANRIEMNKLLPAQ